MKPDSNCEHNIKKNKYNRLNSYNLIMLANGDGEYSKHIQM